MFRVKQHVRFGRSSEHEVTVFLLRHFTSLHVTSMGPFCSIVVGSHLTSVFHLNVLISFIRHRLQVNTLIHF